MWKEKIQKLLMGIWNSGTAVFIVAVLFVVVALLSGNLMAVFGFRYQTVGQLLVYFVVVELFGFPLDLFCQALSQRLYKQGKLDRLQTNLFYIPLNALCAMLAFWLADQMVDSVSATGLSLWVIAFVMALLTQPIKKEQLPEN